MIAERLEATLLKPDALLTQYDDCVFGALEQGCRAIVLPTFMIDDRELNVQQFRFQTDTKLVTVIGFPLGNASIAEKLAVIKRYERLVDEFDIVLNLSFLKSGYGQQTQQEIEWIIDQRLSSTYEYKVKFIIEAPLLDQDEIFQATNFVAAYHAQHPWITHVKTATGFHGKTEEWHVKAIRQALGVSYPNLKIKVAGGIRTKEDIQLFDQYKVDVYGVGFPHFMELIKSDEPAPV